MPIKETCILPDGRRVKFLLQKRDRDPFWLVRFVGPTGTRIERSTKCTSQKAARDAATKTIEETFSPKPKAKHAAWSEVTGLLASAMKAQNLRQRSIDDYLLILDVLRATYPSSQGPHDITEDDARQFKQKRTAQGKSPVTVAGNLNKLSVIWSKWLIEELGLQLANPWEHVEHPKVDEPEPRYIEPAEAQAFFSWLSKRWDGWRLPALFFEVKAITGRRILQLCSLPATALQDGRIVFESESNKGRKMEYARIPDDLFQELREATGPLYVWERYSEQLGAIYRRRKLRAYVKPFSPERLKRWLQDQVTEYCADHAGQPGFVPFTAHDFRGTAFTRAWESGIDLDRAALAYGCNRETMKKHYLRKNQLVVADEVFRQVHGPSVEKGQAG